MLKNTMLNKSVAYISVVVKPNMLAGFAGGLVVTKGQFFKEEAKLETPSLRRPECLLMSRRLKHPQRILVLEVWHLIMCKWWFQSLEHST